MKLIPLSDFVMEQDKIIKSAKDLLEEYERRYYPLLDDVHWVEENECSTDGDYCSDCVGDAKNEYRKNYLLKQRKLPLERRDKEFSKFSTSYSYGGGYEDDDFNCCYTCGKSLNVVVLPSVNNIQDALDDLRELNKVDDYLGYKIYWLLYNYWGNDDERHIKEHELTIELSKKVVETLTPSALEAIGIKE